MGKTASKRWWPRPRREWKTSNPMAVAGGMSRGALLVEPAGRSAEAKDKGRGVGTSHPPRNARSCCLADPKGARPSKTVISLLRNRQPVATGSRNPPGYVGLHPRHHLTGVWRTTCAEQGLPGESQPELCMISC